MPYLLVVPESFAPNDIALAYEGRQDITFTVCLFYLGIKAPAIVSILDHGFISSTYSLSDGATFSGNRLAGLLTLPELTLSYPVKSKAFLEVNMSSQTYVVNLSRRVCRVVMYVVKYDVKFVRYDITQGRNS